MVPDEYHRRLGRSVIVGVIIGLNASADGLKDQGVVFAGDRNVSLCTEDRLAQCDFGDSPFQNFRILRFSRTQQERLPAWIVAVEMFMGLVAMFM